VFSIFDIFLIVKPMKFWGFSFCLVSCYHVCYE